MKKLYTFLAAILLTATTFAQTPEKMSYQAVVRDSGDALVTNQAVGMQISILQTTTTGTAVYVETQTSTTNVNGLVTLEIGTGTVVSGDFTTIDWSANSYFIKTETDPTGGSSYTITGTSQLLSVPYALHAKTVEYITEVDGSITNEIELPTNAYTGDMSYWDGSTWVVIAATPNEGSTLQMIGGVPTWTGGTPPPPATIGDFRAGGVVFWVDPADNTHGLVCALSDWSSWEEWGCFGTDLTNVPNVAYNGGNPVGLGAEIGDGISNTNNILNDCSTAPAALAARSLGNEWFLPSIYELNEMYVNRAILEAVTGFDVFQNNYWSSTEITNDHAWRLRFQTGSMYSTIKNGSFYYVRAVRAF